jgi:predicted ABC-type ATPase
MKPVMLVFAGPNGSGKTTITELVRANEWSDGVEYLNPDEVARDRFGNWNDETAVKQAADWTETRREQLLDARLGIAFETVFSTAAKVEFLVRAKEAGYFIRVFFISTSDPTINGARVTRRVMDGGHTVPIDKIISRYHRSMANLRLAIEIANRAYIFDNSIDGAEAKRCARTTDGLLRKIYGDLPAWVDAALADVPKHPDFEHVPDL